MCLYSCSPSRHRVSCTRCRHSTQPRNSEVRLWPETHTTLTGLLTPQTRCFTGTEWLSTTNRSLHSSLTLLRLSHKRERMEHKLHATEKQTTHQRQRTLLTVIATSSTCTTSPVNSSGTSVNLSECSELCLVSWRDPAAAQAIVSPPTLSDCSLRLVIFTITVSHGRSNDLLNLALGDALLWDQLASATLIHHMIYGHVDFLHTAQRHQQIHVLIHCMSVT